MAGEDFVRELYDASYLRLVIQLYALTGDLADAEDSVQEVVRGDPRNLQYAVVVRTRTEMP